MFLSPNVIFCVSSLIYPGLEQAQAEELNNTVLQSVASLYPTYLPSLSNYQAHYLHVP